MDIPTLTDYVKLIFTLFDEFEQERVRTKLPKRGHPLTYTDKTFLVFFMVMQFRHISAFKTQERWLISHPAMLRLLGWKRVPHRKTLSTRYKALYQMLQDFIRFVAQDAGSLDEALSTKHLVTDKSLFKAHGPVWHQADREANHIPAKLRHLDTQATWSKSGYHGWVYGYGLHAICTEAAFPAVVQVETASVAESSVIDQQAEVILAHLQPDTVAADNSYAKASRIRRWAKRGVVLLSPAYKWVNGRYAQAYHHFLRQPDCQLHLRKRKTSVEPLVDLVGKVLGADGPQKQLPVQGLDNVRTCLALAVFSVQLSMVFNSLWGVSRRNISLMASAFT
jgi:hypothetical protein